MRSTLPCLALAAALATLAPHAAGQEENDPDFHIDGELRLRWEAIGNTLDLRDDEGAPELDDELDFLPYRARVEFHGEFDEDIAARVELQAHGFLGDESPAKSAGDPAGQAASGFDDGDSDVDLYRAVIELHEIGGSRWSLFAGRQEHRLGRELHMGNADFYSGTTFDGVRAIGELRSGRINLFHYLAAERGAASLGGALFGGAFGPPAPAGVTDGDVTLSGATWTRDLTGTGQRIEPYLLYLRDGDSRPEARGVRVLTLGALYRRPVVAAGDIDDNPLDWSFEIAVQRGELAGDTADLGGNVIEGSFGYNWQHRLGSWSRLYVGLFRASGDDDPTDRDVDSFVPLFPDPHANGRLGDLDLFGGPNAVSLMTTDDALRLNQPFTAPARSGPTNVTDLVLGYTRAAGSRRHSYGAALHRLRLTEDRQLAPALVALTGDPAFAGLREGAIGTELDAGWAFRYTSSLGIEAGAAWLAPGSLLDRVSRIVYGRPADAVTRLWCQLRLAW